MPTSPLPFCKGASLCTHAERLAARARCPCKPFAPSPAPMPSCDVVRCDGKHMHATHQAGCAWSGLHGHNTCLCCHGDDFDAVKLAIQLVAGLPCHLRKQACVLVTPHPMPMLPCAQTRANRCCSAPYPEVALPDDHLLFIVCDAGALAAARHGCGCRTQGPAGLEAVMGRGGQGDRHPSMEIRKCSAPAMQNQAQSIRVRHGSSNQNNARKQQLYYIPAEGSLARAEQQ